jgi:hypothetical protein
MLIISAAAPRPAIRRLARMHALRMRSLGVLLRGSSKNQARHAIAYIYM